MTALVLMMLTYPKKAKSKLGGFFYNVGRAILIIFCCRFLMLGKFLANILPLIHFGLIKYFGLLYMNNSYAVKKTIVLGLHLRRQSIIIYVVHMLYTACSIIVSTKLELQIYFLSDVPRELEVVRIPILLDSHLRNIIFFFLCFFLTSF